MTVAIVSNTAAVAPTKDPAAAAVAPAPAQRASRSKRGAATKARAEIANSTKPQKAVKKAPAERQPKKAAAPRAKPAAAKKTKKETKVAPPKAPKPPTKKAIKEATKAATAAIKAAGYDLPSDKHIVISVEPKPPTVKKAPAKKEGDSSDEDMKVERAASPDDEVMEST
eukprot:CAMPEP_0119557022 /NCGR_PEP_ID=MMETSP1352-20130426/8805_1 /TAXON_ID=265584 /ORGANISM="Stauroneis constricta, Strain CCMP1120" /LENGTH=168 /DNA_ID=CAMNT_0007604057 /DNA_START=89 /DNA_END=595 /DNA_ORIENTATION=+